MKKYTLKYKTGKAIELDIVGITEMIESNYCIFPESMKGTLEVKQYENNGLNILFCKTKDYRELKEEIYKRM